MLFQMVWLISDPKANQRLKAASEAGSANAWQALGALSRTVSQGFRAWSAAGARRRAQARLVIADHKDIQLRRHVSRAGAPFAADTDNMS